MIEKLTLKNFRNFDNSEFFFSAKKNIIIGENWVWKTNILLAISLFSRNNLTNIKFENIVNFWKQIFYIETNTENKLAISYDKKENKKQYILNNKKINKNNFLKNAFLTVNFSPMTMNLLYLSPSIRRDFLDEILINSFDDYSKLLQEYKKILISRNKILKNIKEWNSVKNELNFWNTEFIKYSSFIYFYRFGIVDFFTKNIKEQKQFFFGKIENIDFYYKTKIINKFFENKSDKINFLQKQIWQNLEKKEEVDIITWTTNFGPHLDDFTIIINNEINIINFASRWEIKSLIISLKIMEIDFIEKYKQKKPILLIDDLLSELDNEHKDLLLKKINNYQSFITSIRKDYNWDWHFIEL